MQRFVNHSKYNLTFKYVYHNLSRSDMSGKILPGGKGKQRYTTIAVTHNFFELYLRCMFLNLRCKRKYFPEFVICFQHNGGSIK